MDIIKIFSTAQKMSAIRRYSQLHLLKEESVLEHTGFVCLFSYLLCHELNTKATNTLTEYMDVGEVLCKAVTHDIDEVVTGDIPRPTKYFDENSKNTFDKISEAGMEKLLEEMNLQMSVNLKLQRDWGNSKKGNEGVIIAIADLASVVFKIWDEVILLGNQKLIPQGIQAIEYLDALKKYVDNSDMNNDQVKVIENIVDQLKEICEIVKEKDQEGFGSFAPLKSYRHQQIEESINA